jgi:hypothetical protein
MKGLKNKTAKKNHLKLFVAASLGLIIICLFVYVSNLRKPLTTAEVWQRIYDEDIMTKPHDKDLKKYINTTAVSEYVLTKQTNKGYFFYPSPMTYTTSYFLGLSNCLGISPQYGSTYNYVKSLQMGDLGFSETTGEMCWLYTSYYGANSHKWLGIDPRNKSGLIKYIQSFQNEDGGFGSMPNLSSDLQSTFYAVSILKSVDAQPKDANKVIEWMKSKIKDVKSYEEVYELVQIPSNLKYNFSNEEIELLKNNIKGASLQSSSSRTFFILSTMKILNENISQFKDVIDWLKANQKTDGTFFSSDVQDNLYSCQIFLLFNETIPNKEKLLKYVNDHEIVDGGYESEDQITSASNYWSIHTLSLIGLKPTDVSSYVSWTYKTGSSGSWGRIVDTYFSLYSLKLLDELKPNEKIINELRRNDYPNISPYTARYLIPSYMFVQITPSYPIDNGKSIITYQNKDGGFASGKGSISDMYSTFRAIESLHFLHRYLELKNIEHQNWIEEIKPSVSVWIKNSQSKDGGFSWMPGEPAYMQPTYFAVRSLWLLHEKPRDIDSAIEWVKNHQNEDGGFNGGVEKTPSDVLHTFYATGALLMLDDMKGWN